MTGARQQFKAHLLLAQQEMRTGGKNENHIMFDRGTVVHELAVDACRAAGFEPRIFYASLRVESVLGLVASNSGVALMMAQLVAYHRHPEVVAIPLEEVIESDIVLAAVQGRRLPHTAKLFLEFVATQPATSSA